MGSSFRRTHSIITRSAITYDQSNGKALPPTTTAATIMASIQPARLTDYDEAKASALGVDMSRTIRVYTDSKLNLYDRNTQNPGDIVIYQGENYIVFAESRWDAMGSTIDHNRYLATRDELTVGDA